MLKSAIIGASLLWLATFAIEARAVQYAITDLGVLGGEFQSSSAVDINSSGQIVGVSSYFFNGPGTTPSGTVSRSFTYDSQYRDLGPQLGENSDTRGINNSGQIVANSYSAAYRTLLYNDGTVVGLETLISPQSGWSGFYNVYGINNSGQVVGDGQRNEGVRGYRLDTTTGAIVDVGTFGGRSSALGINDRGWVVGNSAFPIHPVYRTISSHAFLYDGTLHDLGMLDEPSPGFGYSLASAINDDGLVTGRSTTTTFGITHAFLYDGVMHDLGALSDQEASYGSDINASGQIVGASGQSAFLYHRQTGMVDLNSLIDPSSGWNLTAAIAINDAGQIVGNGQINGTGHAFLLTPVPEPSTLLLAFVAFSCAPLLRRWREAI